MPLAIGLSLAFSAALSGNTATAAAVAQSIPQSQTVQQYVESYFSNRNESVMVDVARCESTFRQFNTDGGAYRGKANRYDVGVMQINELYHKDKAAKIGLDLSDLEDNVAYAQHLYDTQGTKPWKSSSACWDKTQPADSKLVATVGK